MKEISNLTNDISRADRLSQMVRMVETIALESGQEAFSKTILRDLYRALLPESVPDIPGWDFEVIYRPADILSADFYDFITLPDGKLAISVGDVAGKGYSAVIQMAKASNLIREIAPVLIHPDAILGEVNRLLYEDNNPKAYVTCFIAVLDTIHREMEFANAGHLLPLKFNRAFPGNIEEILITGKPLGIFSQASYKANCLKLYPGDGILFLSDGLLEARNQASEMFSADRLVRLIESHLPDKNLLAHIMEGFGRFLGDQYIQRDDITLIQMVCQSQNDPGTRPSPDQDFKKYSALLEFSLASVPGNERLAVKRIHNAIRPLPLSVNRYDNLTTAVIEAVRNAIHHGNHGNPELPVTILIRTNRDKLSVIVTDSGSDPIPEIPVPDLRAKLAGKQTAFGWGLFLIQQLVDEMYISSDANHHIIEMVMYLHKE